jgi:DNA-binding HxlR family transcriptional regulator
MKEIDDDKIQTSGHGYSSVSDDRGSSNCTAGRPRTRLAGVLSELGCWIPQRASERRGSSQRYVHECASKARSSEAARRRSQAVIDPQMDRSSPKPEKRPRGPLFPAGAYRSGLQEVFSLSCTLSVVGDRWSLQILTLCFMHFSRFGDLKSALRISAPMLAARLKQLIRHGVVERIADRNAPRWHEYVLTQKGRDLYPVVIAMVRWADTHMGDEGGPPSSQA